MKDQTARMKPEDTRAIETAEAEMRTGNELSISYLVVLAGDSVGRVIRLERNTELKAGRVRECQLFFDCDNVSREHAAFLVDDKGRTQIQDLGSTNGTLINGKRVDTADLHDGDRICMGNVILRYCHKDGLEYDFQQNLYDKATRDPLTGVYNKRFFTETLERELAFHRRHELPLSILILDLDHFKKLNDQYGHLNGDLVLKTLGREILDSMRREDTFARFGGEEFVGMFRATPKDQALAIASKLCMLIESLEFTTGKNTFRVTATIGVATMENNNYESAEEMLMAADNNLYIGKTRGRNQVIG